MELLAMLNNDYFKNMLSEVEKQKPLDWQQELFINLNKEEMPVVKYFPSSVVVSRKIKEIVFKIDSNGQIYI